MVRIVGLLAKLNGGEDVRDPVQYRAGKLFAYFRYLDYDVFGENAIEALTTALDEVYTLHDEIERRYFNAVTTAGATQTQSQTQV